MVCLDPSNAGENMAYIPAMRPTLTGFLSPSLSAGVTVPALNTSSWPQYGWHVATGLTQSLLVVYGLRTHSLARDMPGCELMEQQGRMLRQRKRQNTEGPLFYFQPSRQYITCVAFLLFLDSSCSGHSHHFMSCSSCSRHNIILRPET